MSALHVPKLVLNKTGLKSIYALSHISIFLAHISVAFLCEVLTALLKCAFADSTAIWSVQVSEGSGLTLSLQVFLNWWSSSVIRITFRNVVFVGFVWVIVCLVWCFVFFFVGLWFVCLFFSPKCCI